MTTYVLIEIAKRVLSATVVEVKADDVVCSRRQDDEGRYEAVRFLASGDVLRGSWLPLPGSVDGFGQPGTFQSI